MRIHSRDNGNTLICALCTIIVVSLIGANVLINCTRRYNVTAKQLKGWKEALYAAESGGDAGLALLRKDPTNPPFTSDGWVTAPSPAPTPGPAWTKTFSNFGQAGNLSTVVTIDKLTDTTGTLPNYVPYYRIRSVGTARLFGLPRVGLSDQFSAGSNNFAHNSATRGVGDSLLRKIDFKYDHFQATYGDGDGHNIALSPVSNPQVTRRIELVTVPKFFVFGGGMRVSMDFFGPGNAGVIDSYDSTNKTNAHPNSPKITNNDVPAAGTSSYYGPNPTGTNYPELTPQQLADVVADPHDGDVSVGTKSFAEGGYIWGDVTTNGGNVTHSGYNISGTIDNNVPFTLKPLWPISTYLGDTSGYTSAPGSGGNITVTSPDKNNPNTFVYSSITGAVTIKNGNTGTPQNPFAFVKILVNGDITGKITVEKGVTAQIWFTGNMHVKGGDIDNQNVDRGSTSPVAYNAGIPPLIPATPAGDPNPSRVGHLQFYGLAPEGSTQTITIDAPGNVYATFYAPQADMTLTGNPDIFSAVVGKSFRGNGGGGGNTGFHYDKQLDALEFPIISDYQVVSYVEDVR